MYAASRDDLCRLDSRGTLMVGVSVFCGFLFCLCSVLFAVPDVLIVSLS